MSTILLTSTNPLKIEAVERFFLQVRDGETYTVKGFNCNPGLPNQPIDCGQACAAHRIEHLKETIIPNGPGSDPDLLIVSIENDLIQKSETDRRLDDYVHCRIELNGFVGTGRSDGLSCLDHYLVSQLRKQPLTVYPQSKVIKGYDKTGGQLLHEQHGYDPQNWMKSKHGIDRQDQIGQSLTVAWVDLVTRVSQAHELRQSYRVYPDFPIAGVNFKYFYSLFQGKNMNTLATLLADKYREFEPDAILPLESRGLIMGAVLADRLSTSLIPLQKPGKIPGQVLSSSYTKEYGADRVDVSCDLFTELFKQNRPSYRFLIVDDVKATGGTLVAALDLLARACAPRPYSAEVVVVDEVSFYRQEARDRLGRDCYVLFRDVERTYKWLGGHL